MPADTLMASLVLTNVHVTVLVVRLRMCIFTLLGKPPAHPQPFTRFASSSKCPGLDIENVRRARAKHLAPQSSPVEVLCLLGPCLREAWHEYKKKLLPQSSMQLNGVYIKPPKLRYGDRCKAHAETITHIALFGAFFVVYYIETIHTGIIGKCLKRCIFWGRRQRMLCRAAGCVLPN